MTHLSMMFCRKNFLRTLRNLTIPPPYTVVFSHMRTSRSARFAVLLIPLKPILWTDYGENRTIFSSNTGCFQTKRLNPPPPKTSRIPVDSAIMFGKLNKYSQFMDSWNAETEKRITIAWGIGWVCDFEFFLSFPST